MPAQSGPNPGRAAGSEDETRHTGPWVGRRVVIRSLVRGETGPSGGPLMTDTIGLVREESAAELVVVRRDGTPVSIRRADVLVVKEVPPPRQQRTAPPPLDP